MCAVFCHRSRRALAVRKDATAFSVVARSLWLRPEAFDGGGGGGLRARFFGAWYGTRLGALWASLARAMPTYAAMAVGAASPGGVSDGGGSGGMGSGRGKGYGSSVSGSPQPDGSQGFSRNSPERYILSDGGSDWDSWASSPEDSWLYASSRENWW